MGFHSYSPWVTWVSPRQLGRPVLSSSRLHSCLHHWTRQSSSTQSRVQQTQRQADRALRRQPPRPSRLEQGSLLSVCSVSLNDLLLMSLHGWFQDILAYNNVESGSEFPFPIIADAGRHLVETLGMLDPEEKDQTGMPLSARCVSALHTWI